MWSLLPPKLYRKAQERLVMKNAHCLWSLIALVAWLAISTGVALSADPSVVVGSDRVHLEKIVGRIILKLEGSPRLYLLLKDPRCPHLGAGGQACNPIVSSDTVLAGRGKVLFRIGVSGVSNCSQMEERIRSIISNPEMLSEYSDDTSLVQNRIHKLMRESGNLPFDRTIGYRKRIDETLARITRVEVDCASRILSLTSQYLPGVVD
jgi:hypothetical protein